MGLISISVQALSPPFFILFHLLCPVYELSYHVHRVDMLFLKLVVMVMRSTHGFLNPSELFSKNKL